MREDLINKILMMLQNRGIEIKDIQVELTIIMNEYEVTARETAVTVRSEDKNRWLMKKFIIAKTVSGRSDRTIQFYSVELQRILQTINKPADEITTDDIRYYMALRQKRDGVSKVTANNELRVLKSFYGFLLAEELITKNPCLRVEQVKTDKVKKKALTEIEVEKIRNACITTREKAAIEVLLSTGCRITELVTMKIGDLEEDKLIVHGKGGKDRTVYLNAKAIMALSHYLSDRKDSNPYIFPAGFFNELGKSGVTHEMMRTWYKCPEKVHPEKYVDKGSMEATVRKIGKRAGVSNVHPHRLRRTCATFALRRGMPIEQVSKMLGHEQISTTQIYLDLSDDDLQQAHKKYVG